MTAQGTERSRRGSRARSEDKLSIAAVKAMHAASLPVTLSRVAIWSILARSSAPLPVVEIRRRLAERDVNVPLASTYAALKRLGQAGLVASHMFGDGKTYFDLPNRSVRNRLVCVNTGDEQWLDDTQVARSIAALCRSHGFELHDYTLSIQARRVTDAPAGRGIARRIPRQANSKGQVPLRQGDADHEDEIFTVLSDTG